MTGDELANLLTFVSLLISIGALVMSVYAAQKANRIAADQLRLSGEQLSLQHAQVEMEFRTTIENSRHRVEEFASSNAKLLAQDPTLLAGEDLRVREALRQTLRSMIESYLTVLNSACQAFLDKKLDTDRFRKSYQHELREAVQAEVHAEFFRAGHVYHALMMVHDEWENLERKPSKH